MILESCLAPQFGAGRSFVNALDAKTGHLCAQGLAVDLEEAFGRYIAIKLGLVLPGHQPPILVLVLVSPTQTRLPGVVVPLPSRSISVFLLTYILSW